MELSQTTGAVQVKLFSFELKLSLDYSNIREYFFQNVSNSSWANEGYLVVPHISDDPEFRDELARLSQSFGIGVIRLDVNSPSESKILLAAKERELIDWNTANRIAKINKDFLKFIASVKDSIKINKASLSEFDQVLDDEKLEEYLSKIKK